MSVDSIHKIMLSDIPDSYQKTVGFPTYDITKAAAIVLQSLTDGLDSAKEGLDVDNLSGDTLTKFVKQRKGVYRKAATYAAGTVSVTGTGTVSEGDLFESVGGMQYAATETVAVADNGTILVQATTAGNAGNVAAGAVTMMPITIGGISGCTNPQPMAGGYDAESDDSLRERYYEALQRPPTSGNRYHYKAWAKEISGVGDAKVFPLAQGANTVDVVIIDTDGKPAGATLVQLVQDYIDPNREGIGAGTAPIGAYCYVSAATAKVITATVTVTLAAGYSLENAKANIVAGMTAYLRSIAFTQDYVSAGKLASAVDSSTGVADYSNFTVDGGTENIHLTAREVAVLGEVTVHVSE